MGVRGPSHSQDALPLRKTAGTYCAGGWGDPRPIRTGAENLAHTGIRYPDRPIRTENILMFRQAIKHTKTLSSSLTTITWLYVLDR